MALVQLSTPLFQKTSLASSWQIIMDPARFHFFMVKKDSDREDEKMRKILDEQEDSGVLCALPHCMQPCSSRHGA